MSNIISKKGATILLVLMLENPNKTAEELHELSNLTKYNVTKLLDAFKIANLIDKEMTGNSRKLYYLSKGGIEVAKKIKEAIKSIDSVK